MPVNLFHDFVLVSIIVRRACFKAASKIHNEIYLLPFDLSNECEICEWSNNWLMGSREAPISFDPPAAEVQSKGALVIARPSPSERSTFGLVVVVVCSDFS